MSRNIQKQKIVYPMVLDTDYVIIEPDEDYEAMNSVKVKEIQSEYEQTLGSNGYTFYIAKINL